MCSTLSGDGPPRAEHESFSFSFSFGVESSDIFESFDFDASHPSVAPVAAPAPPPRLLRQQSDSNVFTVSGLVAFARSTPLIPDDAHCELPPTYPSFSTSVTRPPRSSAVSAAVRPARPPPTTTTSTTDDDDDDDTAGDAAPGDEYPTNGPDRTARSACCANLEWSPTP